MTAPRHLDGLLPAAFCAWEECRRVFRPDRTDQECCSGLCERRRKRALHPSSKPRKPATPTHPCKAQGCTRMVRGEAGLCNEHSGSRHGRQPTLAARYETEAATATVCPKCGGPVTRSGPLVSCNDRDEEDPNRCGWVEMVRRSVWVDQGYGVRL